MVIKTLIIQLLNCQEKNLKTENYLMKISEMEIKNEIFQRIQSHIEK